MIFADEEVAIEVASPNNESVQSRKLVAAARAGSSAAFAELREMYAQRVFRKLLTMTKNREDAEDALQDTFLRAYMALHTFEERSSFYTWVMRIAINSALMILRRRRCALRYLSTVQVKQKIRFLASNLKIVARAPSISAFTARDMLIWFARSGSFSRDYVRSSRCR